MPKTHQNCTKLIKKSKFHFRGVLTYSVFHGKTGNPGGLNNMVIGIKYHNYIFMYVLK